MEQQHEFLDDQSGTPLGAASGRSFIFPRIQIRDEDWALPFDHGLCHGRILAHGLEA